MTYRADLAGFTGHFTTVADLKAWALALNARHGLKGESCFIHQAKWVSADGLTAEYSGKPTRIVVVGE